MNSKSSLIPVFPRNPDRILYLTPRYLGKRANRKVPNETNNAAIERMIEIGETFILSLSKRNAPKEINNAAVE